jgi:hypothetical protein
MYATQQGAEPNPETLRSTDDDGKQREEHRGTAKAAKSHKGNAPWQQSARAQQTITELKERNESADNKTGRTAPR